MTKNFTRTYLGDCVVSTGEHSPISVNVVPDSSVNVGVSVYFGKDTDTEDTANLSTKSVKMVRAAIYTGANTSGTPLGAGPVDVYIDNTNNSKPYTGDFVSKYWGENGRQDALKISAQTFGLSSAELTASKYTIAILGVYDYTYNYSYLADSAQNLSNYENQLPFETGSTTYYSVSYDEKVPDFPSPLTSGVTVTPITNAKANSYLQGTTKDNLEDDTIVGYNLRANYNNEGGLANSVTYYVMTEKDILGYENDSDTDKGNDPTEWTDWGKDNSPKLKFTLPVNANDRSLPSINIFFMDPVNGVTSTMDSVWNTWGLRMSEEEKVGNTNGGAASYFNSPSNGTVSIFAGPNSNVTRGWHYVFAYKARLTFRNNSNYIFPNNVTGSFSKGTLLSSGVVDTPKQSPDVKMYIEKIEKGGVKWKYHYDDVDGSSILAQADIKNDATLGEVFLGAKRISPTTNELSYVGTDGDYGIMKMAMGDATQVYTIKMNQVLYNENDVMENGSQPTSATLSLASHMYTPPMEPSDIKNNLAIRVSYANNSNTVRFEFIVKNNAIDLNRVSRVTVTGTPEGGTSYTSYYAGFTGMTDGGNQYVGYDLSLLKGITRGKKVTFTVNLQYDSGFGGQYYLTNAPANENSAEGTTGNYIVESLDNGESSQYMEWYYTINANGNLVRKDPYLRSTPWMARYTVEDVTKIDSLWPEDAKKNKKNGDILLKFKNRSNVFPSSYTDEQKEEEFNKQVLQLRLGTSGYKEVGGTLQPLLKVEKKLMFDKDADANQMSVTVGTLSPTINDVMRTTALTTCRLQFRTNSRDLLAEEEDGNRYIVVRVYRRGETTGDPVFEEKIPIEGDQAAYYTSQITGLSQNTEYEIHVLGKAMGSDTLKELLDNDRNSEAIYFIQTMDGMDITGIKASDINYVSYTDKSVNISYGLSLTEGFDITYELKEVVNGVEQQHVVADNDAILAAMGYTKNSDGTWIDKDGRARSYMSEMTEKIDLSKNTLMKPGHQYRLYIRAKDANGESVIGNRNYFATINWDKLIDPGFYVETRPVNNGQGLSISVTPQDPNKAFAEGKYVIALYDSDNKIVENNDQMCVWEKNVSDGIVTVSTTDKISSLDSNKEYKLRIYARKDLENKGTETGLTWGEIENMADAQKQSFAAYESAEKTMDTWGGRFDSIQIKRNAGNQIQILVYNGYNLDNIKMIQTTVNWVDSQGTAHTESKTVSAGTTGLFTQKGTTSTYTTTIPIELSEDDVQYAVTIQFLKEDGGQIYKDTITFTP